MAGPDRSDPYSPFLTGATAEASPLQEVQRDVTVSADVKARISKASQAGPSLRQRTQSELIDLQLAQSHLGNPFSVRHIPFSVLREMTTDMMLAFGWYFTVVPLVRAQWTIVGPDAELNSAVDEALRPIIPSLFLGKSNSMWYGHQPQVKRFKLGRLGNTYRDPQSSTPDLDIPVWSSSADALLWKAPITLDPSHCLPEWDDDGQMAGFKFSAMPIPHFDLLGISSAYGYSVIPGDVIGPDYAMWTTNETELNFGNIYGSPRTKRAYRFWWSYWYRWALADRAYENTVDPAKYVYYPTDFDAFIDPDDPNAESPEIQRARQRAISLGDGIRSGATLAMPGDLAETVEGKSSSHRKWEVGYLKPDSHFQELDATFARLDVSKLRSWLLPENAFLEGHGATGGGGGGGSRLMATQLGEVYEESQQLLLAQWDEDINVDMIPQWIAANFPEKIGTPCRKVSRGIGQFDEQIRQAVLTLVGQVRGEVLPVDIRQMLKDAGLPVLSDEQMKSEMQKIAELARLSGPQEQAPTARGAQGYNAGVMATPTALDENKTSYYRPPERIVLAESDGFANSLPDTPHFQSAQSRSATIRLRKVLLERYREQYTSLVEFLGDQATLHLAQPTTGVVGVPPTSQVPAGLSKQQAVASASAIIAAWAATNATGVVGSPLVAITVPGSIALRLAELETKIALAGGQAVLRSARLHADGLDDAAVQAWVAKRAKFALDSIISTVRENAQNWLSAQLELGVDPATVSKAAEENFVSFPASLADRAARTESVAAFNHGTLLALSLAGVDQVQAHDASDGQDTQTDRLCQERNGRVYTVDEAMQLIDHPNGTLYFVPLSTESLSLEVVDEIPERFEQGRMAAYDPDLETLFVLRSVPEDRARAYMLALGDQLALR